MIPSVSMLPNVTTAFLYCCLLMGAVACVAADVPQPDAVPMIPTPQLVGSCTLQPTYPNDEAAIEAVIAAEAAFVVKQEITALMHLWNDESHIADAKHTPLDAADDQQWLDKDAIWHRYVRTVFPGAPATANPKDLVITIIGTEATVTATTQIGDEVSPAGDRWTLSKHDNCWGIDSLTYNLESP